MGAKSDAQMQERFLEWQRRQPYALEVEKYPEDPEWQYLVAYPKTPLDPLIYGDFGAIVNSTRTALDLTLSALLIRNGHEPNADALFPIRKEQEKFHEKIDMFVGRGWVTNAEAEILRGTKAYEGGDHVLYHLHKLDVLRKHERLIEVTPVISEARLTAWGGGIEPHWRRLEGKTIFYRIPANIPFRPGAGNTMLTSELIVHEPEFGVDSRPAVTALNVYRERARAIILSFN